MDAEQKRRLIDALFEEPGNLRPDASADERRATQIFVETGSQRIRKVTAAEIWQRHSAAKPGAGRRLMFVRWAIPAFAAAAAAVFALVFLLRSPQQSKTNEGLSVRAKTETYRQAVQVFVADASGYTVRESADTVEFQAERLEARLDFKPTADTKSVVIRTPTATFRIIGTSIAISATAEKASLHVAEGKVQVEAQGQTRLVTQGQVWAYENGHTVERHETPADRSHFVELGQGKPVPETQTAPAPKAVEQPADGKRAQPIKGAPAAAEKSAEVKEQKPAVPQHERASEREKSEKAEKVSNRDDRDNARADREARRAEREARRAERQSNKSERHR